MNTRGGSIWAQIWSTTSGGLLLAPAGGGFQGAWGELSYDVL